MTTISANYQSDPSALAIAAQMQARTPTADPLRFMPDVHPSRIPKHVAIIMDGNGRWAETRGLSRSAGHRAGAKALVDITDDCCRAGIEQLTAYSFSNENWKRPEDEVAAIMGLCSEFLAKEHDNLVANKIRYRVIGQRDRLPREVLETIQWVEESTAQNTGFTLCMAFNYGSRMEITDATRRIAAEIKSGSLSLDDINEQAITDHLYTAGMPDPDLLIRTAGEMRLSNFFLWQLSYAEIYVTQAQWPDFKAQELHEAIRAFAARQRRFGGLNPPSGSQTP